MEKGAKVKRVGIAHILIPSFQQRIEKGSKGAESSTRSYINFRIQPKKSEKGLKGVGSIY